LLYESRDIEEKATKVRFLKQLGPKQLRRKDQVARIPSCGVDENEHRVDAGNPLHCQADEEADAAIRHLW